jgi:hypothetical protein
MDCARKRASPYREYSSVSEREVRGGESVIVIVSRVLSPILDRDYT